MRYALLFSSMFFCLSLFAQVNEISEAYLPSGSVDLDSRTKDVPENRLLMAIYGTIKYPAVAREVGVEAIVRIDYTILADGNLRVDMTRVVAELPVDGRETINVTGYHVNGSQGDRIPKKGSKRYEKYLRRQTEGLRELQEETVRVFTNLPLHQPALLGQIPIERSYVHFINYQLE